MPRFLIAVLLTCLALPASGEGLSSTYAELRGGAGFTSEADVDLPGGFDSELSLDPGWLIETAFGYAHGSGLRGELALGYRSNDLDKIKVNGLGSAPLSGDLWAATAMANVHYDFFLDRYGVDSLFWSRFTPYIGAGIGGAFIELDGDLGDEDDLSLAFQGIAGSSYAFTERLEGTLSYRYFSTIDSEFDGVDVDYDAHNVLAGIRFRFR